MSFPYCSDRADEMTTVFAGTIGIALGVLFVSAGFFS
jgi:hypothetical protein